MLYEDDVELFQDAPPPYREREPASIEEATQWLLDIGSRLAWIDAQLGDDLRKEETDPQEYRAWRRRAIAAKTHLDVRMRELRHWVKEEREAAKRQRHEAYLAAQGNRARKLKFERQQYAVLSDAYDSVRLLHEVFAAASLLVEDDSEENWEGLEQAVRFAQGWRDDETVTPGNEQVSDDS